MALAFSLSESSAIIISASGMADAGRILHHLKHNLWRPECRVLFVGYQAEGTLGRILVDGIKKVKLFNEDIEVRAQIDVLPGVSGHADKMGLLAWLKGFENKPSRVFVNHGDPDAADSFVKCLNEELGYRAFAPYSGTCFDLLRDDFDVLAEPRPIETRAAVPNSKAARIYADLVAAAERLLRICRGMEGHPNKVLQQFTKAIDKLSDSMEK